MEDGGFTVVVSRKTRRRRREDGFRGGGAGGAVAVSVSSELSAAPLRADPRDGDAEEAREATRKVVDAVARVRDHVFYGGVLRALGGTGAHGPGQRVEEQRGAAAPSLLARVRRVVAYGLGSPCDSQVSRHQLAFALLLRDAAEGACKQRVNAAAHDRRTVALEVFDPVFTAADLVVLQTLNCAVTHANERGARAATPPGGHDGLPASVPPVTLFYLAHCEAELCDNLLRANWTPQQLPCVAVLGNRFSTYAERWASPTWRSEGRFRPARMLASVDRGLVTEVAVPDEGYEPASAFNDMALHTFAASACAGIEAGEFADGVAAGGEATRAGERDGALEASKGGA